VADSRENKEGLKHCRRFELKCAMKKSFDVIQEVICNPKHPFRKMDGQPKKALKHRYERRKIKEYLHLGDWLEDEAF